MHFTALNFIQYLLKYATSKFKKKNSPLGAHAKNLYDVMYGKLQDFTSPVFVLLLLLSFPRVSVPYEAKESASGQANALILIKRRFPVAHDENLSYKKV